MGVASDQQAVYSNAAIEALYRRWDVKNAYLAGNEFWCSCPSPLHPDNRPAFSINLVTGKWFCLGCKIRGRSISHLIAQMEGISESKAEELLDKFGFDTLATLKQEVRTMLLSKLERPNRNGVDTLSTNEWRSYSREVAPYMLKRGFTDAILKQHKIGYDRWRREVTIPVFEDDVCRFIYTRITTEKRSKKQPSYHYPKGVDKSFYLWGTFKPFSFYEGKTIYLTEGALDALWMRQQGVPHAMAILGSFISRGQIHKLSMMNPKRIVLAFDNDKAGLECTIQTARMLLRAGFSKVLYLRYPNREISDPQTATREQLERMIARRRSARPLANEIGKESQRYARLLAVG